MNTIRRRYPVGAEVSPEGGVHVRVWAPLRRRVEIVFGEAADEYAEDLEKEDGGYFSAHLADVDAGSLYSFRLDGEPTLYPDPASRFQPDGPHGPSMVVDPWSYRWSDMDWMGISMAGQVIYEMHVGTFTREGTYRAAERELPELAKIGITCIELMPLADFPGRFGWGYDGVNLYAPTRLYGSPDDLRHFVDRAHQLGLAVILDVVYNHLGPDGNYLKAFSPAYFTDKYKTDWGEALNYDGPDSTPVREYFAANAAYWIDEFHFDGLRLDATQNIYDDAAYPADHILAEIGRRARAAASGRSIIVVNENDRQQSNLVRPLDKGGFGLDGLWNDDFHYSARVAITGNREAFCTDFQGTAQELLSAVKHGYLFQGQWYSWLKQRRGEPGLDVSPAAFIAFIENHDRLADSARGERVRFLTSLGRYRAITTLLLLGPWTPMLFQGQEFAASSPFVYFADHKADLAELVWKGRREFLMQFPSIADAEMRELVAAPHDPATFERCRINFAERETNAKLYQLTKDLLRLRREDLVFRMQKHRGVDGAVFNDRAFVARFFADDGQDRLFLMNLGASVDLADFAEPLLAPPANCDWQVLLTTTNPRYGGSGLGPFELGGVQSVLPAESAIVLR
jgi:maltooligosyltrehalose trehalohydrolase